MYLTFGSLALVALCLTLITGDETGYVRKTTALLIMGTLMLAVWVALIFVPKPPPLGGPLWNFLAIVGAVAVGCLIGSIVHLLALLRAAQEKDRAGA